jgi:hypothetical protein
MISYSARFQMWYTRPRRPKAGRIPARHAHKCHASSGFAAGASRPPLGPTDTPVSRSVSPFHSFSPSGWNGECIAASAACRSGDPATIPHSGTRVSLPSHWPFAASAFGASACGASAYGAAPSARSFAALVSRPTYRVPCRVYIPLSTFPILLSLFSALPGPAC